MKIILMIVLVCANAIIAFSQSDVTTQSLYWTRYQNHLYFSPSLYFNNEFDNRRFFHPGEQNQFIIHSHLHFKKNKWDFGAGLTLSWIYSQIPENGYDRAMNEMRGTLEAGHNIEAGKVTFQNRLRLDHRFFQESPDRSVFEESFYILRFRYRLQITIPLKVNRNNDVIVGLRLADELMLNHERNTFDQNRIYITCDLRLTKNLHGELGYIYIYQQRLGTDLFFERNVLRLTLLHKIWLY